MTEGDPDCDESRHPVEGRGLSDRRSATTRVGRQVVSGLLMYALISAVLALCERVVDDDLHAQGGLLGLVLAVFDGPIFATMLDALSGVRPMALLCSAVLMQRASSITIAGAASVGFLVTLPAWVLHGGDPLGIVVGTLIGVLAGAGARLGHHLRLLRVAAARHYLAWVLQISALLTLSLSGSVSSLWSRFAMFAWVEVYAGISLVAEASLTTLWRNRQAGEIALCSRRGKWLYLRPFSSTNAVLVRDPNASQLPILDSEEVLAPIENVLAAAIEQISGLEALGHPDDTVEGAGRLPSSDEDWEAKFAVHSRRAETIVLLPSMSSGVLTEVRELRGKGYLHKTIVIQPPLSAAFFDWDTVRRAIWDETAVKLPPAHMNGQVIRVRRDGAAYWSAPMPDVSSRALARALLAARKVSDDMMENGAAAPAALGYRCIVCQLFASERSDVERHVRETHLRNPSLCMTSDVASS